MSTAANFTGPISMVVAAAYVNIYTHVHIQIWLKEDPMFNWAE